MPPHLAGLPSSAALPWLSCTLLLCSGCSLLWLLLPAVALCSRSKAPLSPPSPQPGTIMALLTPYAAVSNLCCTLLAGSQLHLPQLHLLCSADFTQARNFFGLQIEDKFHQPCAVWHRSGHYIIAAAAGQAFVFHVGTTKVWQLKNCTVTCLALSWARSRLAVAAGSHVPG